MMLVNVFYPLFSLFGLIVHELVKVTMATNRFADLLDRLTCVLWSLLEPLLTI